MRTQKQQRADAAVRLIDTTIKLSRLLPVGTSLKLMIDRIGRERGYHRKHKEIVWKAINAEIARELRQCGDLPPPSRENIEAVLHNAAHLIHVGSI